MLAKTMMLAAALLVGAVSSASSRGHEGRTALIAIENPGSGIEMPKPPVGNPGTIIEETGDRTAEQ